MNVSYYLCSAINAHLHIVEKNNLSHQLHSVDTVVPLKNHWLTVLQVYRIPHFLDSHLSIKIAPALPSPRKKPFLDAHLAKLLTKIR